jgi:hypothetical protein
MSLPGPYGRILLTLLVTVGIGWAVARMQEKSQVTVVLHQGGRATTIAKNGPAVDAVVQEVEAQLRSADGVLRLGVTPELIEQLEKDEIVVEIQYRDPPSLIVGFNKNTVRPRRLLVPLTGDYAEGMTTIFHATKEFDAGPYRNSKGVAALKQLIEKTGARIG